MKRYLMIFLVATAAVVSCHKEPVQGPQGEQSQYEDAREVTIEAGTLSKTVLAGDDVWWEGGDKIALIFNHATAPHVNKTFANEEKTQSSERAIFRGLVPNSVTVENGYEDLGYAVYPESAILENGTFSHTLPVEQVALADESTKCASFASGLNLSSAALALSEMGEGGSTRTDFRSALSILRIVLTSDVRSVTLTGTAPLAGTAPLQMHYNAENSKDPDNGRLLVVEGEWSDASTSVTLKPANDAETFTDGTYNILVWPGTQEGLTITLEFKNLGEYEKTSSISTTKPATFKPAKYYKLNVANSEELVVEDITDRLGDVENNLPDLDEVKENVETLLSRIQSVTLFTEYLNNSAYAQYGEFNNGLQKLDLQLDYIIKPESAAEALVEAFQEDHSIVEGLLMYSNASGDAVFADLGVNDLTLADAGFGKYVTAKIDAGSVPKAFYEGSINASVALNIKSNKTEILSDFANLVPKAGSAISGSYLTNIPVIPGARVVIPFNFAVANSSASYKVTVASTENVDWASVNYNTDFRTGNLSVQINGDKAIESQNVTLALTIGEGENAEVVSHTFTFVDNGSRFDLVDPGQVDYVGGEIALEVSTTDIKNYMLSCSGAGVSQSGNLFTFSENAGAERSVTVECQATISGVSLNFYKSIKLTQRAAGTELLRTYYTNGQKVVLNQADASGCSNYFNIVILGDGYQKKDLTVGGKFERSARSAMDSFFSIEPYKTFKNRFNVYMVAYESADEGTDIKSSGVDKNTYFSSYCQGGGNTAAYVADTAPVINAVKAAVGSGDAAYYRSIAVLLLNTDEQAGSTGYPFRDYKSGFANGYASFAIAALAANSTGTNGLIKHEAGGHAFGRLADEYYSNGTTASSANETDLGNWQAKGWYWNISSSNSGNYYKFTNSAYSSSEVSFIEGGWGYQYGMYRPTQGGMMQGSTGVFNAPSRHAIYHRIITESEGANEYIWSNFLDYDQKNR